MGSSTVRKEAPQQSSMYGESRLHEYYLFKLGGMLPMPMTQLIPLPFFGWKVLRNVQRRAADAT